MQAASMTGFARAEGTTSTSYWVWELRSMNGRGLDLRFRLPSGLDGLEPPLRETAARVLKRGTITASLTLRREQAQLLVVDPAALEQAMRLALDLCARIPGCPPPRAEALLALPGVLRPATAEAEPGADEALASALRAGFEQALGGLVAARRAEGERIGAALLVLLDDIAALRDRAAVEAAEQPAAQRARMLEAVRTLTTELPALPEERLAQEVALLAARSDVREELDRLSSHTAAARALLAETGPIGRRLDFLVQEFNREANTLCSKSTTGALTATGLRLKAAIEQLREQVQNVE